MLAIRNNNTPFPTNCYYLNPTKYFFFIFITSSALHTKTQFLPNPVPSTPILLISPITCMTALLFQTAWQLLMAKLTAINGQGVTCCFKCYSWYDSKTEMRICNFRPSECQSLSLCTVIQACFIKLLSTLVSDSHSFFFCTFCLQTQDWILFLMQNWWGSLLNWFTKQKK